MDDKTKALVNYREPALTRALEPIDESLVPDCGMREVEALRKRGGRLGGLSLASGFGAVGSLMSALIIWATPGGTMMPWLLAAFGVVATGVAIAAGISEHRLFRRTCDILGPHDLPSSARHEEELLKEVSAFNKAVRARVTAARFTDADLRLIADRRKELLERIGEFRSLVGAIHAPVEEVPESKQLIRPPRMRWRGPTAG